MGFSTIRLIISRPEQMVILSPAPTRAHPSQRVEPTSMNAFPPATAEIAGHFGLDSPFSGAAGGFRPSVHQGSPRQVKVGKPD
jgi:hypothetical protein